MYIKLLASSKKEEGRKNDKTFSFFFLFDNKRNLLMTYNTCFVRYKEKNKFKFAYF